MGPKYDDKDWPHHKELVGVFAQLLDVSQQSERGKVRFLVMNLIETRRSGWKELDDKPPAA